MAGFPERDGDLLYESVVIVAQDGSPTLYRMSHVYPTELEHLAADSRLER